MYDLKGYVRSNKLLCILCMIMIFYAGILVYCQSIRGVSYWDIFVYLQNAMLFSHVNIGSQLSLPPVFSLLVSIPFSFGFISETSMFAAAGILFILLVIGVYLLFCECFEKEIAFVGSLIFSMFSLIVTWAVTGATDVPALCFGVWALYFTVLGLNKNFNYYYPAILCFVLAFFTRFTEGFILVVMGFYILLNFDDFRKQLSVRRIICVAVFSLVIACAVSGIYISNQGTIPFIGQFIEVSSSSQVSSVNVGYELNPFYYFSNLPEYLTSWSASEDYFVTLSTSSNSATLLSYVILSLVGVYMIKFVFNFIRSDFEAVDYKKLKLTLLVILSLITLLSYTHISYLITEILFTVLLLLYYKLFSVNDDKMDYVIILWMGIFIILHSYHPVKVDRYIIPIMVPIAYLTTKSVTFLVHEKRKALILLTILLIMLIPVNANYLHSITRENPHTIEEKTSAEFLQKYDNNLDVCNISSDRGVAYSWYLKKYTYTTIPRVLKVNNESLEDKLKTINAKYYIDSTSNTTSIEGYHSIYDNKNKENRIKIYEKD